MGDGGAKSDVEENVCWNSCVVLRPKVVQYEKASAEIFPGAVDLLGKEVERLGAYVARSEQAKSTTQVVCAYVRMCVCMCIVHYSSIVEYILRTVQYMGKPSVRTASSACSARGRARGNE